MCQKIVVMLKEDKDFCLVTEVVHKPLMASRQAKDVGTLMLVRGQCQLHMECETVFIQSSRYTVGLCSISHVKI